VEEAERRDDILKAPEAALYDVETTSTSPFELTLAFRMVCDIDDRMTGERRKKPLILRIGDAKDVLEVRQQSLRRNTNALTYQCLILNQFWLFDRPQPCQGTLEALVGTVREPRIE
jgi:hypothetical protein